MNETTVTRLRRLLADATTPDFEQQRRMRGPLGTIRRRYLIQEAKLLAARYALGDYMAALVYAAGAVALTGLALDQLEQVVTTLQHMGVAIDTVCDVANCPPAR